MQILKVIPYSAIQLCTYEAAKRGLRDREGNLSIPARLTAGALAGMTATLVRFLSSRVAHCPIKCLLLPEIDGVMAQVHIPIGTNCPCT